MTVTMPMGGEPAKRYRLTIGGKKTDHQAEMREIPVAEIQFDPDYQRPTNSKWVSEHLPFRPAMAAAIVVSLRGGRLWGVDGRHRVELAKLSGVPTINAFVVAGLTKMEEAALFVRFQRERRSLSAWDLYRAEMAAKEPETVAMVNALNRAGFQIDSKTGGDPRVITAIDSVRFVYRLGAEGLVTDTLKLVTDSMWLNLEKALSGPMLKGIAIFLHSEQQRPNYDGERTVKRLRQHAPLSVMLKAQEIAIKRRAASVAASNVAEAILEIYNERLTPASKLPPITINQRKRPAPKGSARPTQ